MMGNYSTDATDPSPASSPTSSNADSQFSPQDTADSATATASASWINALSADPPSPPFRYDPRLAWRVSSPETPTPPAASSFPGAPGGSIASSLSGNTHGQMSHASISSSSATTSNAGSSSAPSYPSSVASSPTSTLSRSTSYTSSLGGNLQQELYIPDIPVRPFVSTLSRKSSLAGGTTFTQTQPADRQLVTQRGNPQLPMAYTQPSAQQWPVQQRPDSAAPPVESTASQNTAGPSSNHLQPHQTNLHASTSQLTRRARLTSAHFAADSLPDQASRISATHPSAYQPQPNGKSKPASKLSRQVPQTTYISPTTGKRKSAPTLARHAHKRSFSVQWQQFERWERKSKARLRDLLVLLLVILCAAGGIYKLCSSSLNKRAVDSSGVPRSKAAVIRSSHRDLAKRSSTAATRRKHAIPPGRILANLDHPERDTVILYRILGNDLPPRHGIGQTLSNLRFMLSQEDDFSFLSSSSSTSSLRYPLKVEKYYVLNRITSTEALDGINSLFEEFDVRQERVLNVPSEWTEYASLSTSGKNTTNTRWDGGVADPEANLWGVGKFTSLQQREDASPEERTRKRALQNPKWAGMPDWLKLEKQRKRDELTRLRALEYTYHDKNLYAMNNNGGRNFALDHGKKLAHARWVLPLDGNSFFTPEAMASLFQAALAAGEGPSSSPYLIIPMSRLLDNPSVLANNSVPSLPSVASDPLELDYIGPDSPEEPQIGFRFDAPPEARYQEEMRYGRRSKLELLWRIGAIPFSKNLHEKKVSWEKPDQKHITANSYGSLKGSAAAMQTKGYIEEAGWVHRLFSGMREQEESSSSALELRRLNRMKGIIAYLEKLDEGIARGQAGCSRTSADSPTGDCGFRKDRLWNWDGHALADLKRESKAQEGGKAYHRVKAFEARSIGLFSRTRAQLADYAGDEEYWRRAGPVDIARTAARLALVGYLTSNTTYSHTAAQLVKSRFLDLHPHAHHGESISEHLLDEHTYASLDTVPVPHGGDTKDDYGAITGYAFPPPSSAREKKHLWQHCHLPTDAQDFPYDALHFDPSLLLDALRLLGPYYQPRLHAETVLPGHSIRSLLSRQLAGLLLSEEGREISANPSSATQASKYDATVASLAAFLDDAKLLGRVMDRHRVRYMDSATGDLAQAVGEEEMTAREIRETMLLNARNAGWPVSESDVERTSARPLDPVFSL